MIFLFVGIILGVVIGYKLNDLVKKLNAGIEFNLFGYNVYIGKNKKADVVKMDKNPKKKNVAAMKLDKCKTCNNEDMFISGTKNLIACPECKRNAHKFKNKTS